MTIQSARVRNGRAYIGDTVLLIGDTRPEVVAGFKPNKQTGLQLIPNTSRHWIGIPADRYEIVQYGPNNPKRTASPPDDDR